MLGYYSGNDPEVVESMKPQAEQLIVQRILKADAHDEVLIITEFNEAAEHVKSVTPEDVEMEAQNLAKSESKGVFGSLEYLPRAIKHIDWLEFILALSTILIIYGFKRITTAVPSTLVALLIVSGVAYGFNFDYILIQEIPSGLPFFHTEIFTGFKIGALAPYILTAMMLAMLGAIDSLLTSVVADNLTKTQHQPNRELIGQGIGNSIAAMFGGLPGAGATIRTVVNIQAGGKTKISGMIAGLFLFLILISLGPLASKIPAAVLAGILITVGIGVMDYKGLRAWPQMENHAKLILVLVLLLTVFWQLVYAVFIGLILAASIFLKRMSDSTAEAAMKDNMFSTRRGVFKWAEGSDVPIEIQEKVVFETLNGPLFFGMTSEFKNLMSELKDIHVLVLSMKNVPFIDQSGTFALESAVNELHKNHVLVMLVGMNKQVSKQLGKMHVVPELVPERYTFAMFKDCAEFLKEMLKSEESFKAELKRGDV